MFWEILWHSMGLVQGMQRDQRTKGCIYSQETLSTSSRKYPILPDVKVLRVALQGLAQWMQTLKSGVTD